MAKSRALLPPEVRRTNCTVAAFARSFSTNNTSSFVCRDPSSNVKLTALLPMNARSILWTFSKSTKMWLIGGGRSVAMVDIQLLDGGFDGLVQVGSDLSNRPVCVFGDQRFGIVRGLFQGGQGGCIAGISQRDTNIP